MSQQAAVEELYPHKINWKKYDLNQEFSDQRVSFTDYESDHVFDAIFQDFMVFRNHARDTFHFVPKSVEVQYYGCHKKMTINNPVYACVCYGWQGENVIYVSFFVPFSVIKK